MQPSTATATAAGFIMAGPFSPESIVRAIERLPLQSTKDVREMRRRGVGRNLPALIEACDVELAKRPIEFDGDMAARVEETAAITAGMDLAQATRFAFSDRPASDYEIRILRWMAAHPGGTYEEALQAYGKGDLALCIGHLVYDRYGCFRCFVEDHEDQSSVLIAKERGHGSVRYTLRPEILGVFEELGIV